MTPEAGILSTWNLKFTAAPDPRVLAERLAALVIDWRLGAAEADLLLRCAPGTAARVVAATVAPSLVDWRLSVLGEIDDRAVFLLGVRDVVAEWLRTPAIGLAGVSPLELMLCRDDGLLVLCDALRRDIERIPGCRRCPWPSPGTRSCTERNT